MNTCKTILLTLTLALGACNSGSDVKSETQPGAGTDDVQVKTAAARDQGGGSKGGGGRVVCPLPGQIAVGEICNGFDDDCDGVIDEGVCSDPCDKAW